MDKELKRQQRDERDTHFVFSGTPISSVLTMPLIIVTPTIMSINLTKKIKQKQEKIKNRKGFNQAQRRRDATEGIETKQI